MDVDTFVGRRAGLHAVLLATLTLACTNAPFTGYDESVPADVAPSEGSVGGGSNTAAGGTSAFTPTSSSGEPRVIGDELEPAFGGSPRPLAFDTLFAFRFVYENGSRAPFELSVDDLTFVPVAACR